MPDQFNDINEQINSKLNQLHTIRKQFDDKIKILDKKFSQEHTFVLKHSDN